MLKIRKNLAHKRSVMGQSKLFGAPSQFDPGFVPRQKDRVWNAPLKEDFGAPAANSHFVPRCGHLANPNAARLCQRPLWGKLRCGVEILCQGPVRAVRYIGVTEHQTYVLNRRLVRCYRRHERPIANLGPHLGSCDVSSRKRSLTGVLIFHRQADLYAQLYEPHTAC